MSRRRPPLVVLPPSAPILSQTDLAQTTVSTTSLLLIWTPRPSETHFAIRWVRASAPDARLSEAPIPFRPGSRRKRKTLKNYISRRGIESFPASFLLTFCSSLAQFSYWIGVFFFVSRTECGFNDFCLGTQSPFETPSFPFVCHRETFWHNILYRYPNNEGYR